MNDINTEYKEKTVRSVVFSCTINMLLTIGGFYLAYLSLVWSYQNWSMITSSVSSFFLIFKPAKDFLVSHIGKLFIVWAVMTTWFMCVTSKLNEENIIHDTVIIDVFMLLVPFLGFLVFGLIPFKLDSSWVFINVISTIISAILFIFFCGVAGMLFDNIFPKKSKNPKIKPNPEQLNLNFFQ